MRYKGVLLADHLPSGRKGIEIVIDENTIVCYQEDNTRIVFPLSSSEISIGGASNKLVYIKNTTHPSLTLYTTDKSILKNVHLSTHMHAKEGIDKIQKDNRQHYAILSGILLLIGLVIGGVFLFRKQMVLAIVHKIPPAWEEKAGKQLFKQITLGRVFIKDSVLQHSLQENVQPLLKAVGDTSFHFTFYIIEDTAINAFALPGGTIIIHSGLFQKASSWEEVMGVLGHEMAHVTQRHHIRGIIANTGLYVIVSTVIGDVSAIAATIINAGSSLQSLAYSRSYERESDNKGWEYLLKAKINPKGMILFFKKLEKQNAKYEKASSLTSWISTHPATKERIKNLEKKQKRLKEQNFITFESSFPAFVERLDSIIEK